MIDQDTTQRQRHKAEARRNMTKSKAREVKGDRRMEGVYDPFSRMEGWATYIHTHIHI
jgi:hypothetical protein